MGRQSARLINRGKDHKDIFFNGHYHKQMWITDKNANPTLVWEKLKTLNAFTFTVRDTMVSYTAGGWTPDAGTIRLNIGVAYKENFTIDWGDGTVETLTGSPNSQGFVHTYPTSDGSLYTVNVYGDIVTFVGNIYMQSSYLSCIEEIITPLPKVLCERLVTAYSGPSGMFVYCKSIKKIPEYLFSEFKHFDGYTINVNITFMDSGLTELPANIFYGIKKLLGAPFKELPSLQSVNPMVYAGVEEYQLDSAFINCTSLLHAPCEMFTIFNGTSAMAVFSGCTALLSASSINNSTIEKMDGIFRECSKLEVMGNIYVSTLKSLAKAFYGCSSLTKMGGINCENLEDISYIFYGCGALEEIGEIKSSSLKNMAHSFHYCTHLKEVTIVKSNFLEDMTSAFYHCTSLESTSDIESDALTTVRYAFSECSSLKTVPHINSSALTDMGSAFKNCTSLTDIPNDFLADCPNVTNVCNYH